MTTYRVLSIDGGGMREHSVAKGRKIFDDSWLDDVVDLGMPCDGIFPWPIRKVAAVAQAGPRLPLADR